LVFGVGFLLALFSLVTLNGAAEIVCLVSITIFCFGWAATRFGAGSKIIFCGLAVLLVWVLQVQQNNKAERLKIEATQDGERKADEAKKKDAEAFAKMTGSQHLDRAKATLKVGADAATLSLANKDIDALAGTPLRSQGDQLRSHYLASEATVKRNATIAAEKAAKQEAAQEAALNGILRQAMAKSVGNSMLDEGYNVDVTAEGPDHTTLRLKWIFVSKVFAHQLSQQSDIFDNARKIGFKKIVATDD
jgi:hypothetical protein